MKIKSKSHAVELLRELEKQGFIEHSWLTTTLTDGRTSMKKMWTWKTKTQNGSTKA